MFADNIDTVLLPVVDQEIARVEARFSKESSFSAPVQAPQMSSTLVQHQRLSAATPQASSFAQADVEEFGARS
jgi:D-alanyl-D-alanine carboxypeptidase